MPNSKLRCKVCNNYFPRDLVKYGKCTECRPLTTKTGHKKRVKGTTNLDLRTKIRLRDGHTCRWCGARRNLHVHHINYRSEGGSNSVYNLITLCLECHDMVHSKKWYYKPILLGLIWMTYVEKKNLTGLQFIRFFPQLVPDGRP